MDDIGRFAARCFSPLLQDAVAGAVMSLGILETSEGGALLINAQKLVAHESICNLGVIRNVQESSKAALGTGQSDDLTTRPTEKPFLVFSVGDQRFSTPLGSVEEILLAQTATLPMPAGDCGMLGLFASRGHSVPLLDLSHVLGDAATRDGRYIIVTRSDHPKGLRRAGFRVDELHSVDRKVLQEFAAKDSTTHLPGLPGPTIRLSDGHACTVLDLAGAAERLLNVQQTSVFS
ncbi:MAG: chemotaxis protein CheW [Novosphingobium sp.]